eukprot:scaffold13501_cov52-Phaeocystis_antarctica.AAC.1
MSNANGEVVGTRMATHDLPLIVAPVLPDDELSSVETIRVTLPGSTTGPAEVSSGEANSEVSSGEAVNEAGPSEVNWFRISRVQKVNSTAVVFHALGGEQIRVWNGVTTVRLSATGPEIPVCSANVTCAAFQVEGVELAEKYLAKAEALLVPFEEGRRRLAEECLDPFTSAGRDAAQAAATDRCLPTTVAACRTLALKNGLTWGYSGAMSYFGCYAFAENGYAYFGTGGTETQMLQAIAAPSAISPSTIAPSVIAPSVISAIEGGGGRARAFFFEASLSPLRVSSLDTDCLLLSNQAKLEATLESVSKRVSNFETLYLTGTLKVGATVTSIGANAYAYSTQITGIDLADATALRTIGYSAFRGNDQLTGTLKVGPAVTSIGEYAFQRADLTGLDLSEATALETIGRAAFHSNDQLTRTLKVGPAVTSIGDYAFYNTLLTGLDLSDATALQTIGDYAFGVTGVEGLDLSKATALQTIGRGAFQGTDLVGEEKCKSDGPGSAMPNETPRCFTLS